jgi:hypothetical protein
VSIEFRLGDHHVKPFADQFDLALRIAALPNSALDWPPTGPQTASVLTMPKAVTPRRPSWHDADWREGAALNRRRTVQNSSRLRAQTRSLRSAAAVICLLAALPAQASLGGGRDSIEKDGRYLAARMGAVAAPNHTVHLLTLPNGEVIREFARGDGVVFAVTWRGPARPDLRQLLGPRFDNVQADNILPGGRRSRRPIAVRRPDFRLSSGGHSGAFWGTAFLPGLVPPGFSFKNLVDPAT